MSLDHIPVEFDHNGKHYKCHLSKVSGAGQTSVFHLMDGKNFYNGRLRWSDFENKWVFDPTPKTEDLKELADFFGDVVTAWYE